MGINTLSELRAHYGAHGANKSDEDLIKDYAPRLGIDPMELANGLGYDPGKGSLARERASSAIDSYQSNLYDTGRAAASAVGLDRAAKWMDQQRADNKFQSDVAGSRAQALGGIDRFNDEVDPKTGQVLSRGVHGVGDFFGNYLPGLAIQSAPYLGEMAGFAAADLATGGALTPAWLARMGAAAPRAVGGGGLRAGADFAARRAALEEGQGFARTAGAVASSYPSSVGDILSNQREQNPNAETRDGMAFLGGVPYAALNAFEPSHMAAARMRGFRSPATWFDGAEGIAGGLKRAALATGAGGLKEGAAEVGQEFANQYFGRMAVDPNETMFSDKARDRYLESFIGGAALGGTTSGGMGGWRRSEAWQNNQNDIARQEAERAAQAPKDLLAGAEQAAQQRIAAMNGVGQGVAPQGLRVGPATAPNILGTLGDKDHDKQEAEYNAWMVAPSGHIIKDPETQQERLATNAELADLMFQRAIPAINPAKNSFLLGYDPSGSTEHTIVGPDGRAAQTPLFVMPNGQAVDQDTLSSFNPFLQRYLLTQKLQTPIYGDFRVQNRNTGEKRALSAEEYNLLQAGQLQLPMGFNVTAPDSPAGLKPPGTVVVSSNGQASGMGQRAAPDTFNYFGDPTNQAGTLLANVEDPGTELARKRTAQDVANAEPYYVNGTEESRTTATVLPAKPSSAKETVYDKVARQYSVPTKSKPATAALVAAVDARDNGSISKDDFQDIVESLKVGRTNEAKTKLSRAIRSQAGSKTAQASIDANAANQQKAPATVVNTPGATTNAGVSNVPGQQPGASSVARRVVNPGGVATPGPNTGSTNALLTTTPGVVGNAAALSTGANGGVARPSDSVDQDVPPATKSGLTVAADSSKRGGQLLIANKLDKSGKHVGMQVALTNGRSYSIDLVDGEYVLRPKATLKSNVDAESPTAKKSVKLQLGYTPQVIDKLPDGINVGNKLRNVLGELPAAVERMEAAAGVRQAQGGHQTTQEDVVERLAVKGVTKAQVAEKIAKASDRDIAILKASMGFDHTEPRGSWIATGHPLQAPEVAALFPKVSPSVVNNVRRNIGVTEYVADRLQATGTNTQDELSDNSAQAQELSGEGETDASGNLTSKLSSDGSEFEDNDAEVSDTEDSDAEDVDAEDSESADTSIDGSGFSKDSDSKDYVKGSGSRLVERGKLNSDDFVEDAKDIAANRESKKLLRELEVLRGRAKQHGVESLTEEERRTLEAADKAAAAAKEVAAKTERELSEKRKEVAAAAVAQQHKQELELLAGQEKSLRQLLPATITNNTVAEAAEEWAEESATPWDRVPPNEQASYVRAFDTYYGSSNKNAKDAASRSMEAIQDGVDSRANSQKFSGEQGTGSEESSVPGIQESTDGKGSQGSEGERTVRASEQRGTGQSSTGQVAHDNVLENDAQGNPLVRELTPAQSMLLLEKSAELSDDEHAVLEDRYDEDRGTQKYLKKLSADVVAFANDAKSFAATAGAAVAKIIAKVAKAILSVAVVFNVTAVTPNLNSEAYARTAASIPKNITVTKDVQFRQAGKADYNGRTLPPNAKKVVDWIAAQNRPSDLSQVLDPATGILYVMKGGKIVADSPALFGKQGIKAISEAALNASVDDTTDDLKMTPAGRHKLKLVTGTEYGTSIVFKEGKTADYAIHRVYLGTPSERRQQRLDSKTASDNAISYGCVNVGAKFYDSVLAKFDYSGDAYAYMLPSDASKLGEFIPTPDNSLRSTTTTTTETNREGAAAPTERGQSLDYAERRRQDARSGRGKAQKSSANGAPKGPVHDFASLHKALKRFFRVDGQGSRVKIVRTASELSGMLSPQAYREFLKDEQNSPGKAVAFAQNGIAYFIADRITVGNEKAVFLHELGGHLGLERLLHKEDFKALHNQILKWAQKDDGSLESELAQKAIARTIAAGTHPSQVAGEHMAYFLEEAMKAGVDPSAARYKQGIGRFIDRVKRLFKAALEKFDFNPSEFNTQDMVDMAFAAARSTVAGKENNVGAYASTSTGISPSRVEPLLGPLSTKFKRWFGDSKVVDEDGKPLVMYHGTAADIEEFRAKQAGAIFLSPRGSFAHAFSRMSEAYMNARGMEGAQNIIPVYVRAVNPFDIFDARHVVRLRNKLNEMFPEGVPKDKGLKESGATDSQTIYDLLMHMKHDSRVWPVVESPPVQAAIKAMGHDSFYVTENGVKNLAVYDPNQVKSAIGNNGEYSETDNRIQFSKAAPATAQTQPRSTVERTIQQLPATLRPTARIIANSLSHYARTALNTVNFTEDLLNRAIAAGMPSAKAYKDLVNQRMSFVGHHELMVQAISDMYVDLPDIIKGKGPGTANEYLKQSTLASKWGYQPDYLTKQGVNVTVDPEMAKAYNALGAEGQAYVNAVFKHGAAALKLKRDTLLDNTASEYDVLIAAETDDVKKAELTESKVKALDQFGSLWRIRGTDPYAPIKRFGNFVVLAKSDAYIAAEEADSKAEMKKMESDAKHYFVDFAENDRAAQDMRNKLRDSGLYSKADNGVVYRVKDDARNELFKGSATLAAFTALKAQIDAQHTSSAPSEKGAAQHRASAAKLREMVTELYLHALADASARKSEIHRRGIAGDIDMVRAFESQGKADANFLGAIKFNTDTDLAINDMRREHRLGGQQAVLEKSEFFKEIMARHLQSMQYKGAPAVDKLVGLTSKWLLATSPAYYLQNATQPWMVSLPVLAGRHEMGASSRAMYNAYKQIVTPFKNAKVFGNMNFDTLLADSNTEMTAGEKKMLRGLLDSGRIDIGIANELDRGRAEAGSKVSATMSKVNDSLRGLQTKMEGLNRVTTALAAYRLELAKTGNETKAHEYADRIVSETHGDYSAWNAPRAFNTSLGKVALQFRKYQLIQLSLMAKMLKNSFGDAPQAEKVAARKAVAFMLGQAVLVGGGRALPIAAPVAAMFAAAFGTGSGEPPEYILRQMIGDKDVADLLIGGLPAVAGLNLSSFGGIDKMTSIMPFQDVPTDKKTLMEATGAMLGGPLVGLAGKMLDGVGYMANGNYLHGLENLLPKGFGNGMKALRLGTEGVEKRNGDVRLSADEVGLLATMGAALGLQSEKLTRLYYMEGAEHDINQTLHHQTAKIKEAFVDARKDGSSTADAIEAWNDLQQRRVDLGYAKQPLQDLMRAPVEQAKRERETAGGIPHNKGNEKFVRGMDAR